MSKHVIIAWSPEEYEALARLAAEGLTAAEIMRALNADYGGGRTRNAILGAAHRVGVKVGKPNKGVITSALKRKGKGEGRTRHRFREKLRARKRKRKPPVSSQNYEKMAADLFVIDRGLRPKGPPYGVQDLTHRICRWIDGDPRAERPFGCDEPKVADKPYCVLHSKRAWGPSHRGRVAI